ncbi:MAG: iron transporter ATPase [Marmoricola sp.]|nr:iron transporter ATPase [Marmoricola sp.]
MEAVEAVRSSSETKAQNAPVVQVSNLVSSYAGESRKAPRVVAANNISFEINEGEIFSLIGPSGCGKTTTLRSMAGLETPTSGEIIVSGRTLFSSEQGINVPVNSRGIAMVFQSYAIWPHMSVFDNVAFPLAVEKRGKRSSKSEIQKRVTRALETVQLEAYATRRATNLSGGQQQRLALARAIVAEPSLLLLDEPLSNLDAKLRESVRLELQQLQRELGFTSMYVTHDQVEALALSTRIAVMNEGEIQQVGTPSEIYSHPANKFVADFIGRSNFIDGFVSAVLSEDECEVSSVAGLLTAGSSPDFAVGDAVTVAIRPEHVVITEAAEGSAGLGGSVASRQFLGEAVDYVVDVGDDVMIQVRSNPSVDIELGRRVVIDLPPARCRLLRVH